MKRKNIDARIRVLLLGLEACQAIIASILKELRELESQR